MKHIELFMSRLPAEVRLEEADGKTYLRGLPVLRVGEWNGKPYTADDLRAIAENFTEISTADAWEPPMRPFHGYDENAKPLVQDARQTLAWHRALAYDETDQVLKADLEIVDAGAVADLQAGKLRYASAEVFRNGYKSPTTGKTYDTPVYLGAAFVDNPGVKGMPWQLVTNAADYGREANKEDRPMSWIETLKGLLRDKGATDEELAPLDQLAAAPAQQADETGSKPPAGEATPGTDPAIARQIEQLQQANREQAATIDQMQAQARAERAVTAVDTFVREGVLPPAVRPQALALIEALSLAITQPIETLAFTAEGKQEGTRKVSALELLGEVLHACKPVSTEPKGELWQGSWKPSGADEGAPSQTEIDEAAERLAKASG